ncbi:MAG: hypothetical protein ACRCTK_00995 [Alphaproteobacteria bacterium]
MKKLNRLKESLLALSLMTGLSAGHPKAEDLSSIEKQFKRTPPQTKEERYYSYLLSFSLFPDDLSSEDIRKVWDAIEKQFTQEDKALLGTFLNIPYKELYKGLARMASFSPNLMKKLLREQIVPKFLKKNIKMAGIIWESKEVIQVDPNGFKSFIAYFPPNLEKLYLVNTFLGSEMLKMLAPKLNKSPLKELELPNIGITSETAKNIIENTPPTLEFLILDGANLGGILGTLGLGTKPNLKYLSLKRCTLTNTDIQNFATQFSGNNSLKELILSNNYSISDQSATSIETLIKKSSLEVLALSDTSFTGAGLKVLNPAIQQSKLKYLDLRNLRQIEEEKRKILIDIIENSKLESLLLNINVTRAEARPIIEAIKNSNLAHISFHEKSQFSIPENVKNKDGNPVKFSFFR